MAKRKALDFTALYEIHVMQSLANRGKYWSQIVYAETLKPKVVWEQVDLSESRSGALSRAEDELDRMTERWLDEVPSEA